MRYRPFVIFSLLGSALLTLPGHAAPVENKTPDWVCAGYFEKKLDQEVASPGINIYRERFLARKDGAYRRAVYVFPVAFRIMRDHLRSQTATRFGEAAFSEYAALDLGQDVAVAAGGKAPAASVAHVPGDQLASLAEAGISLKSAAAIRIVSKRYNGVPSKNGWSELHMVALNGASIVGIDSTLIVMWRQDSHEAWGTGKSGSLLSFGKHRVSSDFVTSSEFALMERLAKLYNTPFGLYPLSDSGPLQKDAAAWRDVRDWLERYKDKPDSALQTPQPKRC